MPKKSRVYIFSLNRLSNTRYTYPSKNYEYSKNVDNVLEDLKWTLLCINAYTIHKNACRTQTNSALQLRGGNASWN